MYAVAHKGKVKKLSGLGVCGFVCNLVCCSSKKRRNTVNRASVDYGTNFKGEGLILGSILVVDKTGTIKYAHAEQAFDDHPDFSEVVEAAVQAAVAP